MHPDSNQIRARRATFRQLHAAGCFAIPNPWDAASARWLAGLGFQALASTRQALLLLSEPSLTQSEAVQLKRNALQYRYARLRRRLMGDANA